MEDDIIAFCVSGGAGLSLNALVTQAQHVGGRPIFSSLLASEMH